MSLEAASEHVCYVHCNFCNTILAVSVPCNNLYNIVTVRCGHCANLLSVNMGALLQTFPLQDFQVTCMYTSTLWRLEETKYGPYFRELKKEINLSLYQENSVPRFGDLWGKTLTQNHNFRSQDYDSDCGSSSKCNKMPVMNPAENDQPQMLPIRPPGKRQRVPSAYNRFIKEEIQRIKTSNPDISHRQAFSAAAKNWAHFPHIHFGLNLDNSKQVKLDETIAGEGSQKSQGFY